MFQKDYILRMIEQFAKILVRILRLREEKQYPQALQEIGEAYRLFFGLNPELIDHMSDTDLIQFLKMRGQYDAEKCVVLASLLNEDADLATLTGNLEQGHLKKVAALSLFLEGYNDAENVRTEASRSAVEAITENLKAYDLPLSVKKKLFAYYELVNKLDRAEDLLFELLDSDPAMIESAIAFYERLRLLPAHALAEANLPLDEVEEGLRIVKSRKRSDL